MDDGSVPFVAGIPAENLRNTAGRHPAHRALLLYGRAHVGVRSPRAIARTVADADAVDIPGVYANALGDADLDAGHDADGYGDSETGRQRHLYFYCHAYSDVHSVPNCYTYSDPNGDVHPDDDPHRHPNQHADQHTDQHTDQHAHPHSHCDDDPYTDAQ